MFQCSNVQIFKCSNVQIVKCSNFEMLKCSKVQMLKCSNVQMFKCLNVKYQMSVRLNFCRSVPPEFLWSFFKFISRVVYIFASKVHKGHRCHRAIQNSLKFTAYPNKWARSEIYIYVMSIALTLASNQETSDSRALILNNLNITSTKGLEQYIRWQIFNSNPAHSSKSIGGPNIKRFPKKVMAIKLLMRPEG